MTPLKVRKEIENGAVHFTELGIPVGEIRYNLKNPNEDKYILCNGATIGSSSYPLLYSKLSSQDFTNASAYVIDKLESLPSNFLLGCFKYIDEKYVLIGGTYTGDSDLNSVSDIVIYYGYYDGDELHVIQTDIVPQLPANANYWDADITKVNGVWHIVVAVHYYVNSGQNGIYYAPHISITDYSIPDLSVENCTIYHSIDYTLYNMDRANPGTINNGILVKANNQYVLISARGNYDTSSKQYAFKDIVYNIENKTIKGTGQTNNTNWLISIQRIDNFVDGYLYTSITANTTARSGVMYKLDLETGTRTNIGSAWAFGIPKFFLKKNGNALWFIGTWGNNNGSGVGLWKIQNDTVTAPSSFTASEYLVGVGENESYLEYPYCLYLNDGYMWVIPSGKRSIGSLYGMNRPAGSGYTFGRVEMNITTAHTQTLTFANKPTIGVKYDEALGIHHMLRSNSMNRITPMEDCVIGKILPLITVDKAYAFIKAKE